MYTAVQYSSCIVCIELLAILASWSCTCVPVPSTVPSQPMAGSASGGETSGASSATAGSSSSCSSDSGTSLLDRLRAPALSELSRKRKIYANSASPVGKKRSTSQVRKFDPQNVKPSQRMSEFPGEHLCVSAERLFCKACRETLAVKRSVVQCHLKSKKNESSKEQLKKREARERNIRS